MTKQTALHLTEFGKVTSVRQRTKPMQVKKENQVIVYFHINSQKTIFIKI